jgi:glycosyltransferase involved in cell wall biosynthesis
MNEPLISVIMASYNYAGFIGPAVESVLGQSYSNWELLVVDDGSTDDSVAIIENYICRDKRIRLFFHENRLNRGLPATLQLGLAKAKGEYAAFLESDDLWREACLMERLEAVRVTRCRAVFNAVELLPMPGAQTDGYYSYIRRIRKEHGSASSFRPPRRRVAEQANPRDDNLYGSRDLLYAELGENKIPTFSCIMLDIDLLRACDPASPVPRQLDWWLWVQVSHKSHFAYVPQPLTIWRLHPASYNHSTKLKSHFMDSCRMWRGFRCLAHAGENKLPRAYKMLLALPFWCRLLARLFITVKKTGIAGGLKTIRRRLQG